MRQVLQFLGLSGTGPPEGRMWNGIDRESKRSMLLRSAALAAVACAIAVAATWWLDGLLGVIIPVMTALLVFNATLSNSKNAHLAQQGRS